ncbi:DUF1178 family protein [Roseinatronobacter alkalisoli]|uniref:DUF1178 family protein n=1 Tax=Roseinatronobacter alkalisoli TaxID=3028235 RepID=A0ABT5T3R9_9RHOB|nr:DUF1178 family protein [Roseinatronobacter sp. HJB301]MDD7969684.1 DUF1178 family protein [Roseinatronobacter sp. HJB301]
MIKFSLRCAQGHGFESWFQSGAAFDSLKGRNLVTCPVCGGTEVEKALMAPAVAQGQQSAREHADTPPTPSSHSPEMAARLRELRAHVEAHSEYVGEDFPTQARAMYLGDIPDRPIYGEAHPSEAKALIDDGVPVLPLPFTPSRKAN